MYPQWKTLACSLKIDSERRQRVTQGNRELLSSIVTKSIFAALQHTP